MRLMVSYANYITCPTILSRVAHHALAHPKRAKQRSSQSSDGENQNPLSLDVSLIYPVTGLQHDSECDRTRERFLFHAVSKMD